MPKLFLSSQAISAAQAPHFIKLVNKQPSTVQLALIENAADGEDGPKDWMFENRRLIQGHGFNVELIDLHQFEDNQSALRDKLARYDAIWLGGGNTYYLRWLLHKTGAETIIPELVTSGTVYGGGSAGAIVAGPTLKYFEAADDPNKAPGLILEGLSLTDKIVVPHTDDAVYAPIVGKIKQNLQAAGYTTVPLTDAQALVINGPEQLII